MKSRRRYYPPTPSDARRACDHCASADHPRHYYPFGAQVLCDDREACRQRAKGGADARK